MFRTLIGRGHPEFSTKRQQDAQEYLLHLINMVEVRELFLTLIWPAVSTLIEVDVGIVVPSLDKFGMGRIGFATVASDCDGECSLMYLTAKQPWPRKSLQQSQVSSPGEDKVCQFRKGQVHQQIRLHPGPSSPHGNSFQQRSVGHLSRH